MSITATLTRHARPTPALLREPMRTAGPRVIALRRPRWTRLMQSFATAWTEWRAAAQRRRDERLIAALPRHVLCDVGLGHLAPDRLQLPWPEIERARW